MGRYIEHLTGMERIPLNPIQERVLPNYAYFPAIISERIFGASRNEVFAPLAGKGINARKYLYPFTNIFDCFHKIYDPEQNL